MDKKFKISVLPQVKLIKEHFRFSIIIALLCIVISVFIIHDLNASSPQPRSLSYGIALDLAQMKQNQRIKDLHRIKNLGFSEVRFDFDWSVIEPRDNNTYLWKQYDITMKDVKNAGLRSVVTLDRTPVWARPLNCRYSIFCAPTNSGSFAKFAAAAVKRYQGYDVTAWEIWNEPNIVNFWKPAPNPYQYAQLLKAAYQAIKQQDPNSIVIIGGLSGNADNAGRFYIDPRTFLSQLYSYKAKNYFNGVAYHPYTSLRLPQNIAPYNGWSKMYTTSPSIRSIMVANGDQSKYVWITEFGAPTSGPGTEVNNPAGQLSAGADHVSFNAQAQIAQQAIKDTQKIKWIKDLDWYTYIDSSSTTSTAGDSYGLLQSNGNPKPVYFVFKNTLK